MRVSENKRSKVLSTALTEDEYCKFNQMKVDIENEIPSDIRFTVSQFVRDMVLRAVNAHYAVYYPQEIDNNVSPPIEDTFLDSDGNSKRPSIPKIVSKKQEDTDKDKKIKGFDDDFIDSF